MENKLPKYNLIYKTMFRVDAQMVEDLLKNSGLRSVSKQTVGTEALSALRGNAVLPFEEWGVYVEDQFLEKANEILENVKVKGSQVKVKDTAARRIAKPFIWIFLALFAVGLIYSFWFMIKGILESK